MDLLLVGALLALAWIHHRKTIERYGQYGLLLPPVAVVLLAHMSRRYHVTTNDNTQLANVVIYEASLAACTGIMLWALSGRWVGLLTLRPVGYLGRISYSVYLIHTTALYLGAKMFHGAAAVAVAAARSDAGLCGSFVALHGAAAAGVEAEGVIGTARRSIVCRRCSFFGGECDQRGRHQATDRRSFDFAQDDFFHVTRTPQKRARSCCRSLASR
jgi:hypothetical protein